MRTRLLPAFSLALAALIAWPAPVLALDGQVTHLSGTAVARRDDGASRIVSVRSVVREGDLLLTADNTYARVMWADGTDIVMRPNSQLKIDAFRYEEGRPQGDNIVISLIKGGMRAVTGLLAKRNPRNFRVAAPNATIGIRGTQFGALFCNDDCGKLRDTSGGPPANGLHIDVSDGEILVTTQAGTVPFGIGQFGYVAAPTVLPVLVPPSSGTKFTPPAAVLNLSFQTGSVGRARDLECRIQ